MVMRKSVTGLYHFVKQDGKTECGRQTKQWKSKLVDVHSVENLLYPYCIICVRKVIA